MTTLLVIGGTDSSGGAGLTRDTAVAMAMGLRVKPVVTAVTAQTDAALLQIQAIAGDLVAAQIRAACVGGPPAAIKIGMLGSAEIAAAVATALPVGVPVVLDPVLKTSSGGALMTAQALLVLLPRVTLLTPNLAEAAALSATKLAQYDSDIRAQANWLHSQGAAAVLIKGGHGSGCCSTDHLFQGAKHQRFAAARLSQSKRGTGCSLATAIAGYLALGSDLAAACQRAKQDIHHWIAK